MSKPIQWHLSPQKQDKFLGWLIGEAGAVFPYFQEPVPIAPPIMQGAVWCDVCQKEYPDEKIWRTSNNDPDNPHWHAECPEGHGIEED